MHQTRTARSGVPRRDRVRGWALAAFASSLAAIVGMVLLGGSAEASATPTLTINNLGMAWYADGPYTTYVTPDMPLAPGSVVLTIYRDGDCAIPEGTSGSAEVGGNYPNQALFGPWALAPDTYHAEARYASDPSGPEDVQASSGCLELKIADFPEVSVPPSPAKIPYGDTVTTTVTVTGQSAVSAPTGSITADVYAGGGVNGTSCSAEEFSLTAELVPVGPGISTAQIGPFTPQQGDCTYSAQFLYSGDLRHFETAAGGRMAVIGPYAPDRSFDLGEAAGPQELVLWGEGPGNRNSEITSVGTSAVGATIEILPADGFCHYCGRLTYIPAVEFQGVDTFTYTRRNDRTAMEATGTVSVGVTGPPEVDGVPRAVEDAAPNGGDGNHDGTPDWKQPTVASLPAAVGTSYVTIESPPDSVLTDVAASAVPPSAPPAPAGATFPVGLIRFNAVVSAGGTIEVKLYLPLGSGMDSYYKLHAGAWVDVTSLATFSTTAFAHVITLTLTDGGLGDEDGIANGVIVDPGAPARRTPTNPDQCKNDGWKTLRDATGKPFKNQGDCVSYTNSATKKPPAAKPVAITAFTPAKGPIGTSVTITGSGFTGASAVKFNGKNASSFSVHSDTELVAVVAAGTTDGDITVTAPDGTATSSKKFNVGK